MSDDPLVDRVKAAWAAHVEELRKLDNDINIRKAFIAVLRAERDVEIDCLDRCTQQETRGLYIATVLDYDAQIEDEERELAEIISKV